jgi:NodT family efflux transporter outer membrane factor (OMF) lipoprotein
MNSFSAHFPRRRLACLLTASALLGGCAGFQPIAPQTQPIDKLALSMPASINQSQDAWPRDDWWLAYGDPQLNKLMQQALADSPSLATAQARLARAQAALGASRAAEAPQVNGSVDVNYGRQSANYLLPKPPLGPGGEYITQGQAALSFGYDLDLWGRNATLIRSAEAQQKAAGFDLAAARLALTTSIARAYVQLSGQHEAEDVLRATLEQRQAVRKLAQQRASSGLDTQVDVKQAEASEASLRVEQEQLITAMKITRLQLAVLAGQMPAQAETITRPTLSDQPLTLPRTLPLDLLGRRPELAAQRARIEAAIGEADAAKAQFYPNINLAAMIGFQSIGLGQLLTGDSLINSVGPAIRLPIFEGGRLRANYAGKAADIDASIAQYNQSVLNAAQDVAEQLTRAADLAREEAATRTALAASEEAYRLAMLRYRGGLSPYLNVLTVEAQLLAQRRALAAFKSRREDLQVGLVRALGGGFSESTAVAQH